jgi:hypothetical protein
VEVTLDMNARTIEWTPKHSEPEEQHRREGQRKEEEDAGRIIVHLLDEDTTLYPAVLAGTIRSTSSSAEKEDRPPWGSNPRPHD